MYLSNGHGFTFYLEHLENAPNPSSPQTGPYRSFLRRRNKRPTGLDAHLTS